MVLNESGRANSENRISPPGVALPALARIVVGLATLVVCHARGETFYPYKSSAPPRSNPSQSRGSWPIDPLGSTVRSIRRKPNSACKAR